MTLFTNVFFVSLFSYVISLFVSVLCVYMVVTLLSSACCMYVLCVSAERRGFSCRLKSKDSVCPFGASGFGLVLLLSFTVWRFELGPAGFGLSLG